MLRIPDLVRFYLSALNLPVQPMLPTIGPPESRWRRAASLEADSAPGLRPGIGHRPATRSSSHELSMQHHPDKEEYIMSKLRKIWQSLESSFTAVARARVQSTLLTMGPEWVEKYGYSWEALRRGVDAWPWRQPVAAKAEEKEIRRAIRELNRLSDGELRELGLARSGIESAVRFGHPDRGFTFTLERRDEAA